MKEDLNMCMGGDITRNTRVKNRRTGQYGRVLKTTGILNQTIPIGYQGGGGKAFVPLHDIIIVNPDERLPRERKTALRQARKQ